MGIAGILILRSLKPCANGIMDSAVLESNHSGYMVIDSLGQIEFIMLLKERKDVVISRRESTNRGKFVFAHSLP